MATTFTTLEDDYEPGEDWPEGRHHIRTLVEGELADQIRAKAGREGDVVIVEDGAEGGYSEYTVEWDWETAIEVAGEAVWNSGYEISNADYSEYPKALWGPLASILAWLGGDK